MRNISPELLAHLKQPATTVCYLLKIMPKRPEVLVFGLTTLDADVDYDDGTDDVTYRAKRGYTSFDVDTRADMSVDNSEASGLLAEFPADGVTAQGIARGDYDSARFIQYLVNYEDLTMGHLVVNAGQVGQVKMMNDLTCKIELRSLTQILKQLSIIEVTSITCRAKFGDERCKMPLLWYAAEVDTVGLEPDRTFTVLDAPGMDVMPGTPTATVTGVQFFVGDGTEVTAQLKDTAGEKVNPGFTLSAIYINGTLLSGSLYTSNSSGQIVFTTAPADGAVVTWDGTITLRPDGYFVPGVVNWTTGANEGRENEVEEYDAATGTVTLVIPTYATIQAGDTFRIRRDCDKSKSMCKSYDNLVNMRAEPELPRADAMSLQAPGAS